MASLPAEYKYKKTKKYKIQRNTKIQIKTQKYKHKSGGGMPIYGTSAFPPAVSYTQGQPQQCVTVYHSDSRCIAVYYNVSRCIAVYYSDALYWYTFTLLHFYTFALLHSTKQSVLNCTQLNNSAAHFDLYLYFTQHKEIQIQRNEHKYKNSTLDKTALSYEAWKLWSLEGRRPLMLEAF